MKSTFSLLAWLTIAGILLAACGSSASDESAVATSVALTVQAQNELTATAAPPRVNASQPAGITAIPTLTNIVTPPTGTAPGNSPYAACAKASFVTENYPDGTIFRPEESFYKTWQIRNDSNCTWDTSYKIVFWDGDVLGGAYVYNLPQSATPGMVFDIPLYLTVPKDVGTYTGKWMLQTPDGIPFGVGEYSVPLSVTVVVSTDKKPDYGITEVTYRIVRDPVSGCKTNVFYYVYATIYTNGPIDVRVQWHHSDGYASSKLDVKMNEAGTFETPVYKGFGGWSFALGSTTGVKWMQLWQMEPDKIEFGKAVFEYLCGNN